MYLKCDNFKDCKLNLLNNEEVFISYKTGIGKSLCYETYPLCCWLHATIEDLLIIVIEPLVSIIKEQMKGLTSSVFSVTQLVMTMTLEMANLHFIWVARMTF